ncbi:MAG: glycosyltransferase 87 family protein [Bellilinea sp.]
MPQTLGMFFWFGLLTCTIPAKLWLLVEICGYIWIIWLINDHQRVPVWIFAICLLALLLFPPLWVHTTLGQFSMLFVILMLMIANIPKAQHWMPLLLSIGLTKPQLGILVYPGLFIYTWHQKGFRQATWLLISTAISVVLLTIPLFIFFPGWVKDFFFITFDNFGKQWDLPTLFVQLPLILGQVGYAIWALVFLLALAISLWVWYKKDHKTAMIVSLTLTPMVTPYASSWDFMLLLPAFYWLILKLKIMSARVVLLAGTFLVYFFQYAVRWHRDIRDGSVWWVPPVLISVYLISLLIENVERLPSLRWSFKQKTGSI